MSAPLTEAGKALWMDMTANSGGEALHPSWVEHLRSRIVAIETEAASQGAAHEEPATTVLRRAAQWLVDIHADSISIERGSALWEDLQSLRAALSQGAAHEERGLDVPEQAAIALLIAVDNAALEALVDAEDGSEVPDWQERLWDAADVARAVLTPAATPAPSTEPKP